MPGQMFHHRPGRRGRSSGCQVVDLPSDSSRAGPSCSLPQKRRHVLQQEGEIWRRRLDWLSGIRADLWASLPVRSSKDRGPPAQVDDSDVLPASVVARVTTLIQEGALHRACAALLQDRQSLHLPTAPWNVSVLACPRARGASPRSNIGIPLCGTS